MNERRDLSTRDRISELPKNSLDIILVSLPLEEVIRTSILSRDWRDKWVSLPHILLDSKLVKNTGIAYHVLLRLRGTITKFYLDIPLLDTDHWAVSDWIEIVSGNSLQDFKLCIPQSAPYLKLPRALKWSQNNLAAFCAGLLESLTLEAFRDTNLEFQAPKLKFLLITGTISYISITAPILATLSLKVEVTSIGEDNMSQGLQICGIVTVLEKFISKHEINVVRSMLKASPSCLSQVKYIDLHDFLFVDDLKDALLLLRGSPNLQKLIIKEFMYEEEDNIDYDVLHKQVRECYDAEISKEILLSHLEGVGITTGFGYGTQEFIKFLLEKSPALLNIHIQISSEVPIGTGLVNIFLDELLMYPRASLQPLLPSLLLQWIHNAA